jgi:hypothetical protein
MPTATVRLQLTYTPPAAASNSGVPVIDTPIVYEAQNVGTLDIPPGIAVGTVFQIPFGSIAGAQLLMIKNGTSNSVGVKINGAGPDFVASPDATILSSILTLANEIKSRYNAHIANTNGALHAVPDTANVVTSPNASDLPTAITLLNELKTDLNAHLINTGGAYHAVDDTANTVTSANASDLPTAVVLVNELKADFNNHRVQAVHYSTDTCRLESGGTFSYFQPTIPTVNPINSASVTILTAPGATEFISYWVLGT